MSAHRKLYRAFDVFPFDVAHSANPYFSMTCTRSLLAYLVKNTGHFYFCLSKKQKIFAICNFFIHSVRLLNLIVDLPSCFSDCKR